GTTFVSFSASAGWATTTPAVGGTGTVIATNPSLANGASAAFTLVVKVNGGTAAGTGISNTAQVSSATGDPNSANNTATASTTVEVPRPSIPTLSEWGLLLMASLLIGIGVIGAFRGAVSVAVRTQ